MSSFYDKTASIIAWAERERIPPSALVEILRQRLAQCEEYFMWCAVQNRAACDLNVELRQTGAARLLQMKRYMDALGIERDRVPVLVDGERTMKVLEYEEHDLFTLARRVLDVIATGDAQAAVLYDSGVMRALNEFFAALHSFAHRLGQLPLKRRFSDNPYLYRHSQRKPQVSDSDAWLREKYPDEPWETR